MYNILLKYKHIVFLLIKLAIVAGAFYFIYNKLTSNELLSFSLLKEQLSILINQNIWVLIGVLLLTDINWLLEFFKWKTLVSVEQKISFFDAYEHCLASLTTSLITPNRIGEYGAKALYFEKEKRKKIMVLNLIGNLSQLSITIFFGLIGFVYFISKFAFVSPKINYLKLILFFLIVIALYIIIKTSRFDKIIGIYARKIILYIKEIPKKIYFKTVLISLLRYVVFTHQFYFLLLLAGVETNYFTILLLAFCSYFFASIIPSIAIFDWVIKGSIAVWFFSFAGINELTILTITTVMWILNFAIPSIIGSVFVLNFKTDLK